MDLNVEKAISEINFQLHRFVAVQQETSELEGFAERNIMILEIKPTRTNDCYPNY